MSAIFSLAVYGPLVAGWVVTWLTQGRKGLAAWLRRIIHWRVKLRWYGIVVLFNLILLVVPLLLGVVPRLMPVQEIRFVSVYAVSKTAIMRLTENMALELQEHGVMTFALSPGLVNTFGNQAKVERAVVQRWSNLADILETKSIPPEKAANLAVALASGRFDALTGRVFYATENLDAVESGIDGILNDDGRRLVVS